MQQRVAVSDAKERAEHPFRRDWENDAERVEVLTKMQEMARGAAGRVWRWGFGCGTGCEGSGAGWDGGGAAKGGGSGGCRLGWRMSLCRGIR